MSFRELDMQEEYRSFSNDIIKEFYLPVLKKTKIYKRAVGYFSSSALIELSKGITGLVKNNGSIQIIASPELSSKDIEAIQYGYRTREEVIQNSILRSIDFKTENPFELKRLNLLANLIINGTLDIKIAFINNEQGIGIFHEKLGVLEDFDGNKIVFSGSLNETKTALNYNYEAIDVFCSWTGDNKRVQRKEDTFDQLWNNDIEMVKTIEFPEIAKEKMKKFIIDKIYLDIDNEEFNDFTEDEVSNKWSEPVPRYPSDFKIRPYQEVAIDSWRQNNYRGIFDMATGTGKTLTGLAAITNLYNENNQRLAIVIVCPYQHLVEQWVKDIEYFGMDPVIAYSSSKQKNWRKRLTDEVEFFNHELSSIFCIVTTNATFSSNFVQKTLKQIRNNLVIIIDEAHNFGAEHLKTKLLNNAEYRIGLSATIRRHNDEEGTKALLNYFGEICIEYTLKMAINNDMLTPYYYFPIPVYLTEEELSDFREISRKIANALKKDKNGNVIFSESAKFLLIKRARLVAGAANKIHALETEMINHKDKSNILVYCGATTINDPTYKEGSVDEEEKRQIDVVTSLLGSKMNMKVSQFTSQESAEEREYIKKLFAEGDKLQALIAIRCLDEGVNIPSIKTAFILASSTNPKEYVQRRGRVLRKSPQKEFALIYDFITLPMSFEEVSLLSEEEARSLNSLPRREIERMKDFASIAMNPSSADDLIYKIEEAYRIYESEGFEDEIGYGN